MYTLRQRAFPAADNVWIALRKRFLARALSSIFRATSPCSLREHVWWRVQAVCQFARYTSPLYMIEERVPGCALPRAQCLVATFCEPQRLTLSRASLCRPGTYLHCYSRPHKGFQIAVCNMLCYASLCAMHADASRSASGTVSCFLVHGRSTAPSARE